MRTAALLMLFLFSSAAHAVDITSCGQTVPSGRVGVLQTDLACNDGDNSTLADGVTLEHNGTFDLNGHSLTILDDGGPGATAAVHCLSICRIIDSSGGPNGRIVGHANSGVWGQGIRVYDTDFEGLGIYGTRIKLFNVTIDGSDYAGVMGETITLKDTAITGCAYGLLANVKVVAKNATVSGNTGGGMDVGRKIVGSNVTVMNNGNYGIDAIAGDNSHVGRIKLKGSQVLGNPTDLKSTTLPILAKTTCSTSEKFDINYQSLGTGWGVCDND